MSTEHCQRILDQLDDPAVRKIIIMHWRETGDISGDDATRLIRANALEAA